MRAGPGRLTVVELDLAAAVRRRNPEPAALDRDLGGIGADADVEHAAARLEGERRRRDRKRLRPGQTVAEAPAGLLQTRPGSGARQAEPTARAGADVVFGAREDQAAAGAGHDPAAVGQRGRRQGCRPAADTGCQVARLADPLDHPPAGATDLRPGGLGRALAASQQRAADHDQRQPQQNGPGPRPLRQDHEHHPRPQGSTMPCRNPREAESR